jgi:CheY-like chemotaxis protein
MAIMDLHRSKPANAPGTLILSVGQDWSLLKARDLILRAKGYIIRSELSVRHAIRYFKEGDFDLVLVCYSISAEDRTHLARSIRAFGSLIPIVCISCCPCQNTDFGAINIGSDRGELISSLSHALTRIPSTRANVADTRVDTSQVASAPQARAILCIDNDPNLLILRRCLLGKVGYDVLTASSGAEGLKIFSTGIADLVILDYAMPFMNGGVVAAQMRRIRGDIPLILQSGCSSIPDEDISLFDRFIPKGCSPSILLMALEEIFCRLRRQSPAQPNA